MSTQRDFPVLLNVKIIETNSNYKIEADVSGFHSHQVSVSCWEDSLIIEMKASNDPLENYYLGEPDSDDYRRIIPVGFSLTPDRIKTKYRSGTLKIDIRKPMIEMSAKQRGKSVLA